MSKPGKYKVESSYSVHSLEINKWAHMDFFLLKQLKSSAVVVCVTSVCNSRCDFDDTAQYRVSAMNSKGEASVFASVVVKSRSEINHPKIFLMRTLNSRSSNETIK